jgi:hypothetical protein
MDASLWEEVIVTVVDCAIERMNARTIKAIGRPGVSGRDEVRL